MDAPSPRLPTTVKVSVRAAAKPVPVHDPGTWQHAPDEVVDGKYRLVRPLGRGGMAEVWLAVHVNLKTELAVKFLSLALTGDAERTRTVLERFRFEAQISARLGARTRHIVAVHDAGVHEDVPYLVMEYVRGRTLLAEVAEKGPIDPLRFAGILDQIADALTVAHEMGIVHRDLKPSNVMLVDEPGEPLSVKVADFGIAKALHGNLGLDRPTETEADVMLGSPHYMSPEQLASPLSVDVRADIWALGVLAYEVLTDGTPFRGNNIAELIVAVSTHDFVPATKVRRSLPQGLDGWFARALAKEPARRFASVGEMVRAYHAAISAPPPVPRQKAAALTAVALASVGTVVGAAALAWRLLDTPRAAQAAMPLSPAVHGVLRDAVPRIQPAPAPTTPPAPVAPAPATPPAAETPAEAPSAVPEATAGRPRRERPRPAGGAGAAPRATTTAPAAPPLPATPRRKEIDKSEIL